MILNKEFLSFKISSERIEISQRVTSEQTGTSKVGAMSKAQKAQSF